MFKHVEVYHIILSSKMLLICLTIGSNKWEFKILCLKENRQIRIILWKPSNILSVKFL